MALYFRKVVLMFLAVCTMISMTGLILLLTIAVYYVILIKRQHEEPSNIDLNLKKEDIIILYIMLNPKNIRGIQIKHKIENWFYSRYQYSIENEIKEICPNLYESDS